MHLFLVKSTFLSTHAFTRILAFYDAWLSLAEMNFCAPVITHRRFLSCPTPRPPPKEQIKHKSCVQWEAQGRENQLLTYSKNSVALM